MALLSAAPRDGELRLGETETIDLKYVNYGESVNADLALDALGEVFYWSRGTAALTGAGAVTETSLAIEVPDQPEAAGETEFLLVTQAGDMALTNRFNWTVVPEPCWFALLVLLSFGFRKRLI